MRKFGLFSSAAQAALSTLGIMPGDENEQPAPVPAPAPGEEPPADPPATDPPADPPADPAHAAANIVTDAQAAEQRAEAAEAGAAAERARVQAVFAAPEAIANPALAAWLIVNAPSASAESIVGQLKTAPAAPGAAAPAPTAIPGTNISVGAGPASEGDESAGDDVWAEVQTAHAAANAPIVAASAAVGVDGRTTVTAALPRTGH